MAADVSCIVRMMKGYKEDEPVNKPTVLITRDLLGGCCSGTTTTTTIDSNELDLDLQVPSGWEKRLDLKSGKVYIQRCSGSPSTGANNKTPPSSSDCKQQQHHHHHHQADRTLETKVVRELNFLRPSSSSPSPLKQQPIKLLDNNSILDLKLVSTSSSSSSPSPAPSSSPSPNYQSVCTLDKVKFALERAEKETIRKRSRSSSSSSPLSDSSFSVEIEYEEDKDRSSSSSSSSLSSVAAGCPNCLLYVLISKINPKCPNCDSLVPSPVAMAMKKKKPRIDLNMSI